MAEIDIKTVVADFEKKVTGLKREVDNLGKQKLNYQSDVENLSKQQKDLKEQVANLSTTVAKAVEKATKDALDKLAEAEEVTKMEKDKTIKNNGILSDKIAEYDGKIKEVEKLKKSLKASIKDCETRTNEMVAVKNKLESVAVSIRENLK